MNTTSKEVLYPLSPQQTIAFNFHSHRRHNNSTVILLSEPIKIIEALTTLYSTLEITRLAYTSTHNDNQMAQYLEKQKNIFIISPEELSKNCQKTSNEFKISNITHAPSITTTFYLTKIDASKFRLSISTNTPALDERSTALVLQYLENEINNLSNDCFNENQYLDYISWATEELSLQKEDDKFKNILPERLNFNFSNPEPQQKRSFSTAIKNTQKKLSQEKQQNLKRYCDKLNIEIKSAITCLWSYLLKQYTNTSEITLATIESATPDKALNQIIGNLSWLREIKIKFNENDALLKSIQELQSNLQEQEKNQKTMEAAFKNSLNILQAKKAQLYEILISFRKQNTTPSLNSYTPSFDAKLRLEIIESDKSIYLQLFYQKNSVPKAISEYLLSTLLFLLNHLEACSSLPLLKLPSYIYQQSKKAQPLDTPKPKHFVIEKIIENAKKTENKNKTAIVSNSATMSYQQLYKNLLYYAQNLEMVGITEGDVVAIFMDRDLDYIVLMLAIFSIGATALPLSKEYPAERIQFILNDSKPKIIIKDTDQGLPEYRNTINIKTIDKTPKRTQLQNSLHTNNDHPIYVIYTSGSTGLPKKVTITQINFSYYIEDLQKAIEIKEDDNYAFTASLGFSSMFRQILAPLCSTATLVICSDAERKDPALFYEFIRNKNITILDLIPSFMEALIEFPIKKNEASFSASVRLMLSASEPLKSKTLMQMKQKLPNANFINMFGQTETAGIAFTYKISDKKPYNINTKYVPIGRPLVNTKAIILNENLTPALDYAAGKLYLASPCISPTIEKIKIEDFSERLYDTGDLVRVDENHTFHHIGRSDHQIKLSGRRINLLEISHVIENHPAVQRAITTYDEQEKKLITFIKPASHQKPSTIEIRHFASPFLPSYMLPTTLFYLNEVPLTTNRKIDYLALKEKLTKEKNNNYTSNQKLNPYEAEVLKAFSEQLSVNSMRVDENFFEAGADSLKSAKAVAKILNKFDIPIKLTDVFKNPTVRKLAKVIEKKHLEHTTGTADEVLS